MDDFVTFITHYVNNVNQLTEQNLLAKINDLFNSNIILHSDIIATLLDILSFKCESEETIMLHVYNNITNDAFIPRGINKKTILHRVIQSGCSPNIVRLTLERSPGIHQIAHDTGGNTILHCAAKRADTQIIQILLMYMNTQNIIYCASKRNKGGRTPLHEVIDSSQSSTIPIHCILNVSDTKTIWETPDKTGRLPIERIINGTVELYGSFIQRLTSNSDQFYVKKLSVLQRIIRDQNMISISNIVSLCAALIVYKPELLYTILSDSNSITGICDDIFTQIIQKSQYPSIAFKLLGALATSEQIPIMMQKRDVWEQTLFHIAATNFHDLLHCIRMIASAGINITKCLTIYSLKGTPFHIAIKHGSSYDFESKIELFKQECHSQFIDADHSLTTCLQCMDVHNKYPFEYSNSARQLEILFPYIKPFITDALEHVLESSVRVHSYPVFIDLIQIYDADPLVDDSLLYKASLKKELIGSIRPRRVLEYMISNIHPIKVSDSTLYHLVDIAANIASSNREADELLIQSIQILKRRVTIWKKWVNIRKKIKIQWMLYYWDNIASSHKYLPMIGREYVKGVHALSDILS